MFKATIIFLLALSTLQSFVAGESNVVATRTTSSKRLQSSMPKTALFVRGGADVPAAGGGPSLSLKSIIDDTAPKEALAAALLAGGICGVSDIVAQVLGNKRKSLSRAVASATAGLITLGPPAPAFYNAMKELFPNDGTIKNSMIKLFLGNCVYGSIVAVFYYAAALMANSDLSANTSLMEKLKKDLPTFTLFGLVFWGVVFPLRDTVGLALPVFVWTTALSMSAHKNQY